MKHKMSIKLRLTLWFTGFMALMAAVCLLLILVIGSRVSDKTMVISSGTGGCREDA